MTPIDTELAAHTGDDGCLTIGKHDHEELRASYERVAEAVREEIKRALNNEYENTFHWGKDEVFGTYITEKEFCEVIKTALTPPPTETKPTPLPE